MRGGIATSTTITAIAAHTDLDSAVRRALAVRTDCSTIIAATCTAQGTMVTAAAAHNIV